MRFQIGDLVKPSKTALNCDKSYYRRWNPSGNAGKIVGIDLSRYFPIRVMWENSVHGNTCNENELRLYKRGNNEISSW